MEFIRTGMLFLKKSKSLESLIQSHLPVADPALQIKEEVGWGRPRNLFRPFGPKSGLQIRGGGGLGPLAPSPRSATACIQQSPLGNDMVTVIYRVRAICRSTLWKI